MKVVGNVLITFCFLIVSGLFIGTIFLGCDSKPAIKIGFVAGTSGRVADLGISGRDAVQLVIEQTNNTGGINGRPIQLIFKDDQQNPDRARQVIEELINEGVEAIVGPMTSDMGVSITPLLNQARIITVSPTATTQELSGLDDYFFRVSATTREHATKSADYHVKTGDIKSLAVIYDLSNRSFCENWLNNFSSRFKKGGGEILATVGFDVQGERTFLDVSRELLSHAPDGVLIIANSMDSALICQQIRKLNPNVYITLADWGATERLMELGGKAVEGVTVIQTFDRDSQAPLYQAFRKDFFARYQREPGFPGVYAYDAVNVILSALHAQQEGQSLKETILRQRKYEGLQGLFSFDDFGDVMRSNASISIVQDQKFLVLE